MKQLSEMTNEKLWKLFPIIIQKYNSKWPKCYFTESVVIHQTIDTSRIFRISHIGSTAIPGIDSKPTIDIMLETVKTTKNESIICNMKKAGLYLY